MTKEQLAEKEIEAMARAAWVARHKNETVVDEYFKWYHDGKSDPNSAVHYSTIGEAYRDATAAHIATAKVREGAGFVVVERVIVDGNRIASILDEEKREFRWEFASDYLTAHTQEGG